ncbi:MAG: hypothetical protein ACR2NB_14890 [Solirubrobacteraceae bacterium]
MTLGFKEPARRMFRLSAETVAASRPNELTFELTDPAVIWVNFLAKEPGATMDLGPASLIFRYGDSFDAANELEGYERLLHDAMLGDHALFTRADGIERLWEVAEPLLQHPSTPLPYARGSWGPEGIDELVAPHQWHLPYPRP